MEGFPDRVERVPVPSPLLGPYLESIDDLAELKCTLRLMYLLPRKKGYPQAVSFQELLADPVLQRALGKDGALPEALRAALSKAVRRGTLLASPSENGMEAEGLFLLNTPRNRASVSRLSRPISADTAIVGSAEGGGDVRPNIFQLYEENIGLLTPLIAEELKEAETSYPAAWIEEAFREAALQNKRSWRYIERILERWAQEGKSHGEPGRYSKKTDPAAYRRSWGRYASS